MRRLERQALALRCQKRFKFSQRRARKRSYHQLARLIADDAIER